MNPGTDGRTLAERIEDEPEEIREILRRITRPRGPGDPKRHHYVPQFYLRRFAEQSASGHTIGTVTLEAPGNPRLGSVADTAVISEFYTIVGDDNEDSLAIERLLGIVEAQAKPALDRLAAGVFFPPQNADRMALATLLAFQWVRDPHTRRSIEAMTEAAARMQLGLVNEAQATRYLEEKGEEPTTERVSNLLAAVADPSAFEIVAPQNLVIQMMLTSAMRLLPYFLERYWTVIRYAEPGLVTCDRPIGLFQHPENRHPLMPPGPATADEIFVPLDRRTALVLHRDDLVGEQFFAAPPDETIDERNQQIAGNARSEIYAHPDDLGRLKGLQLPPANMPVLRIDGGWDTSFPDGVNEPPERTRPRRFNQARNAPRPGKQHP